MPHLTLETIDHGSFSYQTIWQQRNLVLVVLGDGSDEAEYAERLAEARDQLQAREAVAVVTRMAIEGLSVPGLLIVDRWGRVIHAAQVSRVGELPPVGDILAWLDYIQIRCG